MVILAVGRSGGRQAAFCSPSAWLVDRSGRGFAAGGRGRARFGGGNASVSETPAPAMASHTHRLLLQRPRTATAIAPVPAQPGLSAPERFPMSRRFAVPLARPGARITSDRLRALAGRHARQHGAGAVQAGRQNQHRFRLRGGRWPAYRHQLAQRAMRDQGRTDWRPARASATGAGASGLEGAGAGSGDSRRLSAAEPAGRRLDHQYLCAG